MSAKPLSYEHSIKHQVLRKSTLYIPSFGNVNELSLEHDRWVDVEWEPDSEKLFNVRLSVLVVNERGMLGKIASVIADAESNIDNVSLQDMDGSPFATLNFVVQVRHRLHLAELIRNLRKISKVNKITRVKNYKN